MKDPKDATRLELEVCEMESLNIETLNIEELERRLELTSGLITAMEWGCSLYCDCNGYFTCPTYDPCMPYNPCPTDCPAYCVDCIDCPTDFIVP